MFAGLGIDFGLYGLSASFSKTNRRSVFASEVIGVGSGGDFTIASGCLLGVSTTSRAIPPEVSLSLMIGSVDGRSGSASRSCWTTLHNRLSRAADVMVECGGLALETLGKVGRAGLRGVGWSKRSCPVSR